MKQHESKLLEYITDAGLDIFSKEVLIKNIDLPEKEVEKAIRNLVNIDFLRVIEKGKYCRYDFRNEFVIGNFLASDGGIAYWTAMNYHGLTEQIPNIIFVQTAKKKSDKTIFGVRYRFIQVKPEKLVGYKNEGYGNLVYKITDIEKTIVDCFDLPHHAGGYNEIIKAFAKAELSARKLVAYCKAIDNIAVTKRIAFLSELLEKKNMEFFLEYAQRVRNEKYNLFEPHGEKFGKSDRKWRLIINMSIDEIMNIARS